MRESAKTGGTVVIAIAAMLLSGCASPLSTETTSEPAAAQPTSVDPVVVETEPQSVLPFGCAELLPSDTLRETVADDVVGYDYFTDPQRANLTAYSVLQRGGWVCSAGNGTGSAGETSSVLVSVLPAADSQFAVYEGMYPDVVRGPGSPYGEASNVTCFGRATESLCTANVHVNGYWVELYAQGIDVDASFDDGDVAARVEPLISAIVTPFTTAGTPAAMWSPPADTLELTTNCEVLAPAGEVKQHLNYAANVSVSQSSGPRGGWSLLSGSAQDAGMVDCVWGATGFDDPIGSIHALPGGGWAYDSARAVMAAAGIGHDISTPIVGVEKASFHCLASSIDSCTLSFVMGGNWLVMNAGIPAGGDAVSLEEQMRHLVGVVSSHAQGL